MAKLKFNSAGVAGAGKHAISAKNTSTSVKDGVASIQKNMQSCVIGRSNISARLNSTKSSLFQIENDILEIYKMVDDASAKYINIETNVVKWGQAVVQSAKLTTKTGNNKGAFSPITVDMKNRTAGVIKNNKSTTNNFVVSSSGTVSYKNNLSKGIWGSQGLFNPILESSKYEGKLFMASPKLHPTVESARAIVVEKSNETFDLKLADLASGIVSSAGTTGKSAGGIISTVSDIYSGYKDEKTSDIWKGILGIGDTMVSTIGDLVENGYKVKPDWKETIIGNWKKGSALTEIAEKTAKYADDDVLVGLWKSELDGFVPSTAKNVGENLKVGAQWFGVAVSGITNGMDNYADYKEGNMSANRAVVETVSETAVDVAIGAGSVALVGASIAALGLSAPAVAVGAIAAGAVWLVDLGVRAGTKALTEAGYMKEEKGLTEVLSDTLLYVAEKTIEHKVNKIKNIGNAICNVGNFIGTKWGECFG